MPSIAVTGLGWCPAARFRRAATQTATMLGPGFPIADSLVIADTLDNTRCGTSASAYRPRPGHGKPCRAPAAVAATHPPVVSMSRPPPGQPTNHAARDTSLRSGGSARGVLAFRSMAFWHTSLRLGIGHAHLRQHAGRSVHGPARSEHHVQDIDWTRDYSLLKRLSDRAAALAHLRASPAPAVKGFTHRSYTDSRPGRRLHIGRRLQLSALTESS